MILDFEKWHGCKNDFLVVRIDANENYTFDSLRRQTQSLCRRDGSSIGADGIICLHMPPGQYVFPDRISIINSDGTLAETCGNGIRCAAGSVIRAAQKENTTVPEDISFSLSKAEVTVRTLGKLPHMSTPLLAVEMGEPTLNETHSWHNQACEAVHRIIAEKNLRLQVDDIHTCEILNQHIVVFCDTLQLEDLRVLGPSLQSAGPWDGMNLHLVSEASISDDDKAQGSSALSGTLEEKFDVLVWERGAGETAACGSGACAIGAAILDGGLSSRDHWLQIQMPGGALYVKQGDKADPVILAGPAQHVFDGKVEI